MIGPLCESMNCPCWYFIISLAVKLLLQISYEGEIITTEVITEIIDPVTEITVGPEIGMVTEMATDITIDQITEGMMAIKDMVIEAKITVDLRTETEKIGVAPKTDMKVENRIEMIPGLRTDPNLDLDPLLM